jgi:hypothetical protein
LRGGGVRSAAPDLRNGDTVEREDETEDGNRDSRHATLTPVKGVEVNGTVSRSG